MNNDDNNTTNGFDVVHVPQLSALNQLSDSFNESQLSHISSAESFRSSVSKLLINFTIPELEKLVTSFISRELVRTGLLSEINSVNQEVVSKLEKIKFFSGKSSYFTGFFSTEFSADDQRTWSEIEKLFDSIYNTDNGKLKQIQDHFLFRVRSENLKDVLSKDSLSFEEELFLRSIFVKCYLSNLRELILPFYEISDDILINFKKKRVAEIESLEDQDLHMKSESALLCQQISELESRELLTNNFSNQQDSKIDDISEKITAGNLRLNKSSIALGSIETIRYFTSFIGHKSGLNVFKSVGNLGLKAGSAISRLIPLVSTAVEGYTQVKNNEVVYNYEKRLKLISVVENVKRNLLILEQQVTNHYIDNILTRLQSIIIENNQQIYHLADLQYQQHLQNDFNFSKQIVSVRKQYQENIAQIEKDEILTRQEKINQLNSELLLLQNDIESAKRELLKINHEKKHEEEKLNLALASVEKDLALTKNLLASQQDSLRIKEKNATKAIIDSSSDFQSALIFETEKRKETEATVYVLLEKERQHKQKISNLEAKSELLTAQLKDEKDYTEANQQFLTDKVSKITAEKISLVERSTRQQKEIRELFLLKEKTKDYQKIINEHWKLKEKGAILGLECSKLTTKINDLNEGLQARQIVNKQQVKELNDFKLALARQRAEKEKLAQEVKIAKEQRFSFLVEKVKNLNAWVFSVLIIITLLIVLKITNIFVNLTKLLVRKKKGGDEN